LRRDAAAQRSFWASVRLPPVARDEIRVSLFCYPNPALPELLDAWAEGDVPVTCIVPEGVAVGALDAWTEGNVPHPGAPLVRGRLALHAIPFLDQDGYDRLLWLSTVNFVRGEDSFVRAQWAAHPLVWHIYPQAEGTHWEKLDAFLDRYAMGIAPSAATAMRRFWRAWNGTPGAGPIGAAWLEFAAARPHLEVHAGAWAAELMALPELAAGLVKAAGDQV
jgi:uncharacterized repeat protein (TIGR03837 family)